jgi:hypothetical protein
MSLGLKVNFDKEIRRIEKEAVKIAEGTIQERTRFTTEALKSVTPVDTGYAASRWKYEMVKINGELVGKIDNDAPYIGILNTGYSKQAPPFFIEQVLLTIGEVSAPINFSEK